MDATIVEEQSEGDDATRLVIASSFVGPMPPPNLLRDYEAVLPGAADRLLSMAESALAHEQRMDVVRVRRSYVGLGAGLAISLLFGWFAYRLGQQGHDWLAAALGGANLAGLVAIFVLGLGRARPDADEDDESVEVNG